LRSTLSRELIKRPFTTQSGDKDQWTLNVSFTPGHEKQRWSMEPMMKSTNSSGEGDAHSMAHTVCLIAKGTGGRVIE
jgi:hypothetical protein